MKHKKRLHDRQLSIASKPKHVLVCFADIAGFTRWTRSPLYSHHHFRKKIVRIYTEFINFQNANNYFTKLMGDGLFCVVELDHNRAANKTKAVELIRHVKGLIARVQGIIRRMNSPKPDGFRVRLVAGDVWKFEVKNWRRMQVDYVGHPVNFAFNLLRVRPDIPFMAHYMVKSIVNGSTEVRAVPIKLKRGNHKGVDLEELNSLWDFELTS